MSVYYYALHCINQFAPKKLLHWPTPTLDELHDTVHSFCAVNWSKQESEYLGKHRYTTDEQFAYRCMEGLYIITLLDEAFGFSRDSRDITLALDVAGSEVEWTLGYALAEVTKLVSI
jgi:hypothetical protein